jgi:hypothetical protein
MRISNGRNEFDSQIKNHDINEGKAPMKYRVPNYHETKALMATIPREDRDHGDEENQEDGEHEEEDDEEADDLKYTGSGLILRIE